ncbi:SEC-C domain-containing protein [Nocardioides sp. ChNu-153]|uniref:DUF5926 family protein n=1 Tax=unclassified Nocardioides TaxID=2615069 RepID=UPI0024071148|nr:MULTISPECIES: DUF5926 family protein [unclassified Nocardioides]MDF9714886.1 SEC-C domain-containing protein [Nocardioides sp. ChNu-99]MDN7123113.1 SEC-C domain-containing protein [Nocardioides sp. ChNu-153]
MAKRSRTKARDQQTTPGEVGPRQPCPCGSGRRYKACHGSPDGPPPVFVRRPFEGLASECDLVALRELVPAATAPLTLRDGGDREVLLATLLPGAAPAYVGADGRVVLALQVLHGFGDPSRDLGAVLTDALAYAEAGDSGTVGLTSDPGEGPRLQDLLVDGPLDITVHPTFGYWADVVDDESGAVAAAAEQADAQMTPTRRLESVTAAYWTDVRTKEHLRWAMPQPEDELLDALARLHAAGADEVAEGSRLVGMFRAHGLLTPVWDLPSGTGADVLEDAATAFAARLDDALAESTPLTTEQRSVRSALAGRQVTIR